MTIPLTVDICPRQHYKHKDSGRMYVVTQIAHKMKIFGSWIPGPFINYQMVMIDGTTVYDRSVYIRHELEFREKFEKVL